MRAKLLSETSFSAGSLQSRDPRRLATLLAEKQGASLAHALPRSTEATSHIEHGGQPDQPEDILTTPMSYFLRLAYLSPAKNRDYDHEVL